MRVIEIEALSNGAHRNQTGNAIPEGWAIIPDDVEIPASFPFVDIEVEDGIVTAMTARSVPEPEPEDVQPTEIERLRADIDFLLAMGGFVE